MIQARFRLKSVSDVVLVKVRYRLKEKVWSYEVEEKNDIKVGLRSSSPM